MLRYFFAIGVAFHVMFPIAWLVSEAFNQEGEWATDLDLKSSNVREFPANLVPGRTASTQQHCSGRVVEHSSCCCSTLLGGIQHLAVQDRRRQSPVLDLAEQDASPNSHRDSFAIAL